MTQISSTPITNSKPDSVLFSELAIAAGLAGNPVAVCFTESAAAVDRELCSYLSRMVDSSRVLHIHSQADVRKLTKTFDQWRLVLVHVPRLYEVVAWTVRTHDSEKFARPAIFSRFAPESIDDVPIPLLVLRNTSDESSAIVRWLIADCPQGATLESGLPSNGIAFDPALFPLMVPTEQSIGIGPVELRDCKLLAALLCGACLIRFMQFPGQDADLPTCGQVDYEQVHCLLQSPLISTAEEPINQLAVDMVGRTNVFLDLKCNPELSVDNTLRSDASDPTWSIRGCHTQKELTTRAEIANLGNIRSRLIHLMIDLLKNLPSDYVMLRSDNVSNGYSMFQRMGLVRQPQSETEFKNCDTKSLAQMLRPWSCKQVRTNFGKLQKSGLITGVRESRNGPWQYELPEELSLVSSSFRSLPTAHELFAEADLME